MPIRCPQCLTTISTNAFDGRCPKCQRFIGDSEPEVFVTAAGESLPAPPTPEEIQPLFPHLEIVRLLGRGGMGAVYEARQRGLGRTVALKLLWAPKIPDAGFEERFSREGQALAQLSHDNVVAVHDAGKSGGYYWILMEYVDGPNLRQVLQEGQLDPERALPIVMQMCAALDYAHQQGIVHRDIKPENILMTRGGRVKIADFGLAKILAHESPGVSLTGSMQAMGTPHYMAPEQIESPKLVDHRADIYSLGVVLYEVLTGELPIGRFLLPSRKAQVDSRLDDVVTRAMQKDPSRRYQAVSEVRAAVRNITSGKVTRTRLTQTARPVQRKSNALPLTAAIVAIALGLWFVGAQTGILSAATAKNTMTAEEHLAKGRTLVASAETLEQGIAELESAYALNAELPDLRDLLGKALRQGVINCTSAARLDKALVLAHRAQAIAPSPDADELVRATEKLAVAEASNWVRLTPADGAILSKNDVTIHGQITRTPFDGHVWIGGKEVTIVSSAFDHRVSELEDGEHSIPVEIKDSTGMSLTIPLHFVVAVQPPALDILFPKDKDVVQGQFKVGGTIAHAPKSSILVNDKPASVNEHGEWAYELHLAQEGEQSVSVKAIDALGRSAAKSMHVIVDTTKPSVDDLGQGLELVGNDGDAKGTIRVIDAHLQSVLWDGAPIAFTPDGRVELRARPSEDQGVSNAHVLTAIDKALNKLEVEVKVRRDTVPPEISLDAFTDPVFPGSHITLKGKYFDSSSCELVVKGGVTQLAGGVFAVPISVPSNCVGGESLPISFTIRDKAKNESSGSAKLSVVAPCSACRAEDGHRGLCVNCDGVGRVPGKCTRCKDGVATEQCSGCKGGGHELCATCGGSGKGKSAPCTQCNGTKKVGCDRCGATGLVTKKCETCEGKGVVTPEWGIQRKITCPFCKGNKTATYTCSACSGAKTVKCSQCKNGTVIPPCPNCTNGSLDRTCEKCGGTGTRTATCTACNGTSTSMRECPVCFGHKQCKKCGGSGMADPPSAK